METSPKYRITMLVALAVTAGLPGCAGYNEKLARLGADELVRIGNHPLCIAAHSQYSTQLMDEEIARRELDCAPYLEADREQQRVQAEKQRAAAEMQRAVEEARPKQTTCRQDKKHDRTICTTQ
ncbi:MAG: hypothetical protein LBE06_04060 [Azoarcus sp.]|nr:hypothetical protein [Azoarcus sp.]